MEGSVLFRVFSNLGSNLDAAIQRISEDIRACLSAWKAVKASAESLRVKDPWCLLSS